MNRSFLNLFLKRTSNNDEECDCQPTWLALALVILPAILPVLIDKIGDFLMHYFFGEDDKEEKMEETIEEKSKKKKSNKSKRVEEA